MKSKERSNHHCMISIPHYQMLCGCMAMCVHINFLLSFPFPSLFTHFIVSFGHSKKIGKWEWLIDSINEQYTNYLHFHHNLLPFFCSSLLYFLPFDHIWHFHIVVLNKIFCPLLPTFILFSSYPNIKRE